MFRTLSESDCVSRLCPISDLSTPVVTGFPVFSILRGENGGEGRN